MPAPTIVVRDLVKSFGPSPVLKGVSLELLAGKVNFIIGRSGEGKSVLLKILTGLYQPDSGSVHYGRLNLAEASRSEVAELRRNMGLLFQDGALFDSMSVGQNVVFPLLLHGLASKKKARQKAVSLLDELGMEGTFDKKVFALSTGERKRVGLARALVLSPEVVFFDEPTTGLDPLLSSQVDELILHVQKTTSATVVVVSHDIAATLTLADQVTLLHQGLVVFSGSPEAFRQNKQEQEVKRFLNS
jgi:phospholipid/cholesterol/gamma-HCH transport system ATP-binding protein